MNIAANQTKVPAGTRLRLRKVTEDLHLGVERHFALAGRTWTRDAYCALLARLWGFYAPLEHALAGLDWQGTGIVLEERRKLAWLEADLSHLGVTPEQIAHLEKCHDFCRLADVSDGLGALYVLEGSTLGGQVILRTLQLQLDISALAGGRFFASYGRGVGPMWRDYLDALESAGKSSQNACQIERAALDTFGAFDRWFSQADLA